MTTWPPITPLDQKAAARTASIGIRPCKLARDGERPATTFSRDYLPVAVATPPSVAGVVTVTESAMAHSPHRNHKGCQLCKPHKNRLNGRGVREPWAVLRKIGNQRRLTRRDLGDAAE